MYQWLNKRWIKHIDFLLCDVFTLQCAVFLAYLLIGKERFGGMKEDFFTEFALCILMAGLLSAFFFETYSGILRRGALQECTPVFKFVSTTAALMLTYLFLTKNLNGLSRQFILEFYALGILFVFCGRQFMKYMVVIYNRKKGEKRYLLIITDQEHLEETRKKIKKQEEYAQISDYILGIWLDDEEEDHVWTKGAVLYGKKEIYKEMQTQPIDDILINLPNKKDAIRQLVDKCVEMGITSHVNLVENDYPQECENRAEWFLGYQVMTSCMKFATPKQLFFKRAMDICGGIVGCILCGIIFIFIAPVIKRQSPGPLFFVQERIGRNGRRFFIYKFRTMYPDAEKRLEELLKQQGNSMEDEKNRIIKLENDPRIFPFGHFLREKSLDEFPQFWNVLKGDMSLVGTRPPTVREWEQYDPKHRSRMAVKPGLTGLWQVSGRSDIKNFDEIVALDTKYIREWRLSLDIKILLQTIYVVATGKGAK